MKSLPTWMWRNTDVLEFVEWLRVRNAVVPPGSRAGFYRLDLYSLHASMEAVLKGWGSRSATGAPPDEHT